jgi:hypothetical protein
MDGIAGTEADLGAIHRSQLLLLLLLHQSQVCWTGFRIANDGRVRQVLIVLYIVAQMALHLSCRSYNTGRISRGQRGSFLNCKPGISFFCPLRLIRLPLRSTIQARVYHLYGQHKQHDRQCKDTQHS